MEEVPAHVHPGPLNPDVLTRQHERRSGLIWSGDHETCITDLQFRRFGHSLFQSYNTAPRHMLPNFSGRLVHVRYLSLLEDFEAISTYSWSSCVLSLFDCPIMTMTSMLQEVDDMATRVIQGPSSSPT
ncbi:hypothetical protein M9H77_30651 [Catharanthus roseus]|uniref:Uncharacterized protein n=1 Tax=Catharanthus roseus TaxID=4058 RepID=A0ACB9ZYP7_CATRO|nr:hypothetical protein M9H77_30651 [Catharanthus roseus]